MQDKMTTSGERQLEELGLGPTSSSSVVDPPSNDNMASSSKSTSKKREMALSVDEPLGKKVKKFSPAPEETVPSTPRFPSPPEMPASQLDKESWQGFCEIESEPAYFSVILREMGVEDVTVREVLAMQPDILADLPKPIYGLILLFRYRTVGGCAPACPPHVWFANQLPAQNSCGTLAMIQILLNTSGIEIGEHLRQFKEFTAQMTPYQRGETFASFEFVKKIHNSFAKKMDMLESDRALAAKASRAAKVQKMKQEVDGEYEHRKGKGKGKNEKVARVNPKSQGKSKDEEIAKAKEEVESERRVSIDSNISFDSDTSYEDNAHHFIALLPIGSSLWKLDGMDAGPTDFGPIPGPPPAQTSESSTTHPYGNTAWLESASNSISAIMDAANADDYDYTVLALAESPLVPLRKKTCRALNTLSTIETRLDTLESEWRAFTADEAPPPSPRMLGIEKHMSLYPTESKTATTIAASDLATLLEHRGALLAELSVLSADFITEMSAIADEDEKAMDRRFDRGPVIQMWLRMLAENGWLEANIDRFVLPEYRHEVEGAGAEDAGEAPKGKGKGKAKAKPKGKAAGAAKRGKSKK